MNKNDLLKLLIAFLLGYFAYQIIGKMCGGRLVEGGPGSKTPTGTVIPPYHTSGYYGSWGHKYSYKEPLCKDHCPDSAHCDYCPSTHCGMEDPNDCVGWGELPLSIIVQALRNKCRGKWPAKGTCSDGLSPDQASCEAVWGNSWTDGVEGVLDGQAPSSTPAETEAAGPSLADWLAGIRSSSTASCANFMGDDVGSPGGQQNCTCTGGLTPKELEGLIYNLTNKSFN